MGTTYSSPRDAQDTEMVINRLRSVDKSWSLAELAEALTFHTLCTSRGTWANATDAYILENSLHLKAVSIIREKLKLPASQLDETDVREMYQVWAWIGNHSYGRDAGGISARLDSLIKQYDQAAEATRNITNFNGDIYGHNQQFNAGSGEQKNDNDKTVKTAIIEYDNSLLNNPGLLSAGSQVYGMRKTLDAALRFDDRMISEIVQNNDEDLLLAGILSFED